MARVVVDVMLKPEILDPQGKAVHGAFGRLGFGGVADVRQGKRFEITLDGDATEERVAEIRKAAETLLANPVIEDFTIHIADETDVAEEADEAPEATASEETASEETADEEAAPEEEASEDAVGEEETAEVDGESEPEQAVADTEQDTAKAKKARTKGAKA